MNDTLSPAPACTQPTLFIPHGAGPCFFMQWNPPATWDGMAGFLRGLAAALPSRPRAILMVSAHWLAAEFRISAGQQPGLIYDYYGFPEHTYQLAYPAPGEPALAGRVAQALAEAGFDTSLDHERGFDHGMFIPLKLMFPDADIPVVQLSLRQDLDPAAHLVVGAALAPLRDAGVLIVGSGMSFHNMRGYGDPRFTTPSLVFDEWLTGAVEAAPAERDRALAAWARAPHAHACHPAGAEEHLIPLLVAAGAAARDSGRKIYSDKVLEVQLSAFRFG
ncbi:DODA-type extradiol aromatic ring-opening family dioxygenase [Haliea sp. E17]|uniref:DODA-type extradiol aromatic ring-opening family dioxygenase n=1 Tax=Haliea sp. E17 TaxID=3401576 RepID=UPI003AB02545